MKFPDWLSFRRNKVDPNLKYIASQTALSNPSSRLADQIQGSEVGADLFIMKDREVEVQLEQSQSPMDEAWRIYRSTLLRTTYLENKDYAELYKMLVELNRKISQCFQPRRNYQHAKAMCDKAHELTVWTSLDGAVGGRVAQIVKSRQVVQRVSVAEEERRKRGEKGGLF